MDLFRRDFLAASIALLGAGSAAAENPPPTPFDGDPQAPAWPPAESFPIWPGSPPGARLPLPVRDWTMAGPADRREIHVSGVSRPELHVYRPERPNGIGLLVCPGGSYRILSVQNEGMDAAKRFNPLGFTLFQLTYRLPAEGWDHRADVPLQDAQRALRLIRAKAKDYRIDPDKLGVLGFSAGGHLAASLTTGYDEKIYSPVDTADQISARPSFTGLMYPVISLHTPLAHVGSRDNLLGPAPSDALIDARSPDRQVTAQTPPCFLGHAIDDRTVPVDNSLAMLQALREKKIAAECHLFEAGGHGFGFHLAADMPAAQWPSLFAAWIGRHTS